MVKNKTKRKKNLRRRRCSSTDFISVGIGEVFTNSTKQINSCKNQKETSQPSQRESIRECCLFLKRNYKWILIYFITAISRSHHGYYLLLQKRLNIPAKLSSNHKKTSVTKSGRKYWKAEIPNLGEQSNEAVSLTLWWVAGEFKQYLTSRESILWVWSSTLIALNCLPFLCPLEPIYLKYAAKSFGVCCQFKYLADLRGFLPTKGLIKDLLVTLLSHASIRFLTPWDVGSVLRAGCKYFL